MFKSLFNSALLLAGVGFLIIILTTPNASSNILSRLSNTIDFKVGSNNYLSANKASIAGCRINSKVAHYIDAEDYKYVL